MLRPALLGLLALNFGCRSAPAGTHSPPADGAAAPFVEIDASALLERVRAGRTDAVLVDVWASWCAPCVEELPKLVELDRERSDLEVVFVSADLWAARPEACQTLARFGVARPYLFQAGSGQAFIDALNPEWSGVLPAHFLYRQGQLVGFWEGALDYDRLRAALANALERSSGPR